MSRLILSALMFVSLALSSCSSLQNDSKTCCTDGTTSECCKDGKCTLNKECKNEKCEGKCDGKCDGKKEEKCDGKCDLKKDGKAHKCPLSKKADASKTETKTEPKTEATKK